MLAIIGYVLTIFMAFTLIPLLAVLIRILLTIIFTRIYWKFSSEKSAVNTAKVSVRLAQILGFFTAIFHGYAALWMGIGIMNSLGADYDLFLGIFLVFWFVWFGLRKRNVDSAIQKETPKNEKGITFKDGDPNTIVLNPEVASTPEEGALPDPSQAFNEQLQNQFKEQAANFLQGNTTWGVVGRVIGTIIATVSYIPLS